jgi:dihydropyrimidinase
VVERMTRAGSNTPPLDTLIRGGRVVTESGVLEVDIGIAGERVVALVAPGTRADVSEVIDADGAYVVPGSIDSHTHIRVPVGDEESEDDFDTATAAAVVSGTTTIIDFIHTARDESPLAAAEKRLAMAEGKCVADYGFHPILTSADARVRSEIAMLVHAGFASFKMYTTYPNQRLDDGEVWQLMREIARAGGLPGLHTENHELLTRLTTELVAEGRVAVSDFPASRPPVVEADTIGMVARFARHLETPVFIFHMSGGEGLDVLRDARASGVPVIGETCTHYLAFDDGVFRRPDSWKFVITPPIRDAAARDSLWQAIRDGFISSIGSDHVAYTLAQKTAAGDSFTAIPAGAPGIEVRVPMLLSEGVNGGRLTIEEFVAVTATRPARVLGLYPRKGTISVGSDADLVLVDLDRPWTVADGPSPSGAGWSIYGDYQGRGHPRLTMLRGTVVARDGKFVGRPGAGRFLERRLSMDALRSVVAP